MQIAELCVRTSLGTGNFLQIVQQCRLKNILVEIELRRDLPASIRLGKDKLSSNRRLQANRNISFDG